MDDDKKPVCNFGRKKLTAERDSCKQKRSSKEKSMKKLRYFDHIKPATEKYELSLRPGVQGFFITCHLYRRRLASKESMTIIEMAFEDLVLMDKHLKSKSEEESDEEESDEESVQPSPPSPKVKKQKTIDEQIEDEIDDLAKNKDRFLHLHTGCNGILFLRMLNMDEEPGPEAVVKHIFTSMAAGRGLRAKFVYRILPIEVACYASVERISEAIKPLIEKYFLIENQRPIKFAVLYKARANTNIDKTAIIDVIANSVPQLHRVDLNNAETTIVVQIVKTICLLGVVENYNALWKYNVRAAYTAGG